MVQSRSAPRSYRYLCNASARLLQRVRNQRIEQTSLRRELNATRALAAALEGRLNASVHASSHQRRTASWRLRSQLAPMAETLGALVGNEVLLSEAPRGVIEEQPLRGGWVRFRKTLPSAVEAAGAGEAAGGDGDGDGETRAAAARSAGTVRIPLHESLGAHVRARTQAAKLNAHARRVMEANQFPLFDTFELTRYVDLSHNVDGTHWDGGYQRW